MKEIYNEAYYRNYHMGAGVISYENTETLKQSFERIADRIVADFHPKTVLDAGCALGFLVAALRDRGVDAYGIDISEYAISRVREDIRPFCKVGSLTEKLPEGLPETFDLVTSIEVLEHLYAEDGSKAIQNLCSLTDTVLFSSSPDDFEEPTHVNVQQRECWSRLFFENGFTDDITYRPDYVAEHAILFRKSTDFVRLVEDYERVISRLEGSYAFKQSKQWGKVYFDSGEGFCEDSSAVFTVENEHFSERFVLPKGCRAVRFDPAEGSGCLLWNLEARTENGFVSVKNQNGTMLGSVFAFKSNDPQIYFTEFETEHQYIDITADILPLSQSGWIHFLDAVDEMITNVERLQSELQQKAEIVKQAESESAAYEAEIDEIKKQLDDTAKELDDRNLEILDYSRLVACEREQAAAVAEAYSVVVNSAFWKITKPARVVLDCIKLKLLRPLKKILLSLKHLGVRETLRKMKRKFSDKTCSAPAVEQAEPCSAPTIQKSMVTGNPVDGIKTIFTDTKVKRLNLVTDTIDASSLLGGVATALIVATEFANRYGYELRIITRNTDTNPVNYENIIKIAGIKPAEKLSFYSDYERFERPTDFRMEISEDDIFFATSWWSAEAIKNTSVRHRFFYIIQEVESFFYNYGGERLLCEKIMEDPDIDFIINSHYLNDYFAKHNPNIAAHGCYFEPAFPSSLYSGKTFARKNKYKLFFYARPNNPRNLYPIGVELLQKAVDRGILDLSEWEIYCVGQNAPVITFSSGEKSINMGQLSWTEYADFLADIDLGLCLMYTPHPSYPPFDVASSGGVVLTNKMLNKQTFDMCKNVIMADLDEEAMMHGFEQAVALAKNTEQRKKNYEENTIPRDWHKALEGTVAFMGKASEND